MLHFVVCGNREGKVHHAWLTGDYEIYDMKIFPFSNFEREKE